MTKSKTFWAVAALLSLGVMMFAGYSVYERISLHFSGDTVEIKPTAPPPVPQTEEEAETPRPQEKTSVPEKASAPEKAAAPEAAKTAKPAEPEKTKAIKTVFAYKNAKAKSVYLAGSFTSWKDVKMTKKDGVWKTDVYILPGTYPYHFTADGVKKADPAKPKAPTGDSLISVAGSR